MRSGAKVCKSCRSRQELSNKNFVQFSCKHRLRYSRERASQSLPKNKQQLEQKVRTNIGSPRQSPRSSPRGHASLMNNTAGRSRDTMIPHLFFLRHAALFLKVAAMDFGDDPEAPSFFAFWKNWVECGSWQRFISLKTMNQIFIRKNGRKTLVS